LTPFRVVFPPEEEELLEDTIQLFDQALNDAIR
jgi:hypothetical protein